MDEISDDFSVKATQEKRQAASKRARQISQDLADSQERSLQTFARSTPKFEVPAARRSPENLAATKQLEAAPRRLVTPLGSFKKGGKVPKTGMYQLHAGEVIIPDKKVSAAERLGTMQGPDRMEIERLTDESFQITHKEKPATGTSPTPEEKKFSARNPKALTRHVRQTYGGDRPWRTK